MAAPTAPSLVSIGVPAYNEERFIDATLRSLRAQDWPNLEILVSDNASTDRTFAICERHAAEDPRVRLRRHDANIGATANFESVLDLARGDYFMWAGAHDLWTPNHVSACMRLLAKHPDACVAFASSRWIGADDEPLARSTGWTDTRGLAPIARLFTVFWGNMHPIMGVIRMSHLRACLPLRNIVGGDLVFLSQLALRGDFLHAGQACWIRREFRTEMSHDEKVRRYQSSNTGIGRSPLARLFPLLDLPLALARVVWRSGLRTVDKVAVLVALAASLPLRYLVGKRGHSG